ncbi:copper homeostasis protein CutC [Mucilaginibacter myungsuensis]|uniref:PF03932 family protein CutC n=1 Tax=Mucilaginibacter myungsuensis TaxID=649104 RepID=A0A929KTS2_9SPHI|nr:copper homeostasis protein CutC [Mucilaginibacter myungsuensis]MBE9660280.1 copper homeostasis protein CutC [Mucilaginibacter myungsuensis]MDN3600322.1 copper homeostasis protein CutC [Mucilaginibacter myungsuensis]
MVSLEVCANSATSAIAAQAGGAIRVELCNNLHQGGTTPSQGHIVLSRKALEIQVYTIIRPRSGDFLYTDDEFEIMKADVEQSIDLGCDGVVFGILNKDGSVDMARNAQLIGMAHKAGLGATFHRAFDVANDMHKTLEDLIELGFERVLTSGGRSSAMEGISNIHKCIEQANGRINIMPGAGINADNVANLIRFTNATEIHSSARAIVHSAMEFRNDAIMMGSRYVDEYATYETDANIVRKLIEKANGG